ncbi:uncharacterized protein LOC110179758 [Drosophila serrata]|uniref:uncharacterized protein LOC110179758 n=1 Tax=Drosophila serrata TaxID=7274 RepID=UPI000A1CF727|nr:uncharacterized protein LOC110179758 [Drosophila serrata]
MKGLRWVILLIVSTIWLHSVPKILAKSCPGSGLQLRSTEPQIDLNKLSPGQLKKLAQQLANFQSQDDKDEEVAEDEEQDQEPELENSADDHRGSSRPWNRIQRIIRRQLVKIPKRYLRKILRQFGLARSLDDVELQEYYLIPLE